MSQRNNSSKQIGDANAAPEEFGHPRGTLVIVAIFGALFALGWLAMYVWRFLEQGAPHS